MSLLDFQLICKSTFTRFILLLLLFIFIIFIENGVTLTIYKLNIVYFPLCVIFGLIWRMQIKATLYFWLLLVNKCYRVFILKTQIIKQWCLRLISRLWWHVENSFGQEWFRLIHNFSKALWNRSDRSLAARQHYRKWKETMRKLWVSQENQPWFWWTTA